MKLSKSASPSIRPVARGIAIHLSSIPVRDSSVLATLSSDILHNAQRWVAEVAAPIQSAPPAAAVLFVTALVAIKSAALGVSPPRSVVVKSCVPVEVLAAARATFIATVI